MSVYAVMLPVTAHATSGQATPASAVVSPTATIDANERASSGSRLRVAIRWMRCSSRSSANASPLGRVSAIADSHRDEQQVAPR